MSSQPKVNIIFGAASIDTLPELDIVFDTLSTHGVETLDTARLSGASEAVIGSSGASKRFRIDTKAPGWQPGTLTASRIKEAMTKSLKDLELTQVDVYYLHAPDTETPLEETLGAINELYLEGKFKRFGISNYPPVDVKRIHEIAVRNGWVVPTVFEGNYNPVSRHIEADLFPVLRKLSISFNAYSPLAGGFLVRSAAQLSESRPSGRFDQNTFTGKLYLGMYGKPSLIAALENWEKVAADAGVTKAALAYRWMAHHSELKGQYRDGMVIGASSLKQLQETLKAI